MPLGVHPSVSGCSLMITGSPSTSPPPFDSPYFSNYERGRCPGDVLFRRQSQLPNKRRLHVGFAPVWKTGIILLPDGRSQCRRRFGSGTV